MSFNLGKLVMTVIMIIVTLTVASSLDDTLFDTIDNVTGDGFVGTALLAIVQTLYWLIISAVVIVEMILGFGLGSAVKRLNKMSM